MKRVFACAVMVAFVACSFVGCGEESKTTSKETVKTPSGKTTVTDEKKVEKSGSSPPPASK